MSRYKDKTEADYAKQWRTKNKEHLKKYRKELDEKQKLDHYIVYYLPNEHYCGVTNQPHKRMHNHKREGKNIENWRVLYTSTDRKTAHYYEAMFHSVLAMEGVSLKAGYNKRTTQ